jgi:hypothetical protein
MRPTTRPRGRTGGRPIRAALVLGSFLTLGLAACAPGSQAIADGCDPLRSLAAPAESGLYDFVYWTRVERAGGRLWRDAAAFCAGRPDDRYPNCGNLRHAAWWNALPASLPFLPPPSGPPLPAGTAAPAASPRPAPPLAPPLSAAPAAPASPPLPAGTAAPTHPPLPSAPAAPAAPPHPPVPAAPSAPCAPSVPAGGRP